ncbi:MAG: response regulator transcription factor [Planctomycetes bacterium]|nr:response regulator transcription factor [Planctomycetota bacterium]MCH8118232.1 response regulator transcription factor [Planctomycetota bacterium]
MLEFPNPPIENVAGSDSSGKEQEIILLNNKEWLYVKKRYSLTPRECQIAKLICRGQRNGNIAKFLHISPGTVKTHTRNIYRKARVKSKIAMLLRFVTDAKIISTQFDQTHFSPISD